MFSFVLRYLIFFFFMFFGDIKILAPITSNIIMLRCRVQMSYQVQCVPVVQKIVPRDHCLKGQGPMKSMTTQQHDYYGQCVEREKKIVPRSNLGLFDCPMAKLTTTNCSYQPVCTTPVESFKPRNW